MHIRRCYGETILKKKNLEILKPRQLFLYSGYAIKYTYNSIPSFPHRSHIRMDPPQQPCWIIIIDILYYVFTYFCTLRHDVFRMDAYIMDDIFKALQLRASCSWFRNGLHDIMYYYVVIS